MPEYESAPDSWVGQSITLTHAGGDRDSTSGYTLQAVNDRGIVVEAEEQVYFYPWSAITRITLGARPLARRSSRVSKQP